MTSSPSERPAASTPTPDDVWALELSVESILAREEVLREVRVGYDEFYESGDKTRLLNAEALLRGLIPAVRDA